MRTSELSIVLLTKNGGALLERVLAALLAQRAIAEAEILLIDSGSSDGTLERARGHAQIRVHEIPPAAFGHGRTRNLGVRLTHRPLVVFLVQDATPCGPDFLRELCAPLADPGVAGAFCRQVAYEWASPVEKFFLESQYPPESQVRRWARGDAPMKIGDLFFSNVGSVIRRSVLEGTPFDETLVMSEDQEWSRRVLRAGWALAYRASAVVRHSHAFGLGKVFQRNFDSGASLRGVTADRAADLARYEARFLVAGIRNLLGGGKAAWIPYFLCHEAMRSCGFALGRRQRAIPAWLRRRLSLHGDRWNRAS